MASTFDKTQPVTRDHVIAGRAVRMVIDAKGITFYRKGDKHREKAKVFTPWEDALFATNVERDEEYVDKHLGFSTQKELPL